MEEEHKLLIGLKAAAAVRATAAAKTPLYEHVKICNLSTGCTIEALNGLVACRLSMAQRTALPFGEFFLTRKELDSAIKALASGEEAAWPEPLTTQLLGWPAFNTLDSLQRGDTFEHSIGFSKATLGPLAKVASILDTDLQFNVPAVRFEPFTAILETHTPVKCALWVAPIHYLTQVNDDPGIEDHSANPTRERTRSC